MALNLDTSGVREKIQSLIDDLEEKGFTIDPALAGGAIAGRHRLHSGGPAGTGPTSSGPPKPGEVDARLLKGEYVFSREAVRAFGGLTEVEKLHRALRGGFSPHEPDQVDPHSGESFGPRPRRRRKFHDGGPVLFDGSLLFDEDFLRAGLALPAVYDEVGKRNEVRGMLDAKLKPTGWTVAFDPGSTKGQGTPGMNALNNWIHKNYNVNGANYVAGPTRFINFDPSLGLSQHAFGNAGDYTALFSTMDSMYHGIIRAANSRTIRTLGHAIFNRTSWSYNSQHIGPYGGSIPHTDHVHVDALPQWAGPWPGHPVPPASYHRGGIVQREGTVHPGELVFDENVTKNFVKALTRGPALGGGTLAMASSIPRPALGTDRSAPQQVNDGSGGGLMEVALDVDGTRLSRTIELHNRRTRILLPARGRGRG
jgi:hypothetical protein